MKRHHLFASTVLAGLALATVASAQTGAQGGKADKDNTQVEEVVVTGVFGARAIESAPISVNVVTAQQLQQQTPVSATDLLKNVPGVFVNSALGEIRNIVFSRGVSANSLDGANGYYYVSLQEDGLPTDVLTATNYGPDYFLRQDLTLSRLEGLRGGTAAITGPNAPGGIFNYISKTGRNSPGTEIQTRLGLEGNGKNPSYRADFFTGGALSDHLYYSVGGFYRTSRGAHDPGYTANKGGQIKGNLLYDYDKGSVLFTAKYLRDRNIWADFVPAYGAVKFAPGFDNTSSNLQPANGAHCYPKAGGGKGCWNPKDLALSQSLSFGANWTHELAPGFKLENKARYSHNNTNWNTGAVLAVVPITDVVVSFIDNTAFAPGTFRYYNHDNGQLLATVNSLGFPGGRTVTSNNLPGQNVFKDGVFTGFAAHQVFMSDQVVDQLTLSKDWGAHHLAVGGYGAIARLKSSSDGGGVGLMTLTDQPTMLDVTVTTPAGALYRVTDPSGFAGQGQPVLPAYSGSQKQFSIFFGDTWTVTPKLTVDAGGRYERIRYDIVNKTYNNPSANVLTAGGVDGNPLTMWDNNVSGYGPEYRVKRDYDFFNYSLSASYEISDDLNTYVRYTLGKKAPDFGTIEGLDTPSEIATVFPSPQRIEQIELGVKYNHGGLNLQLFPFYSKLSNVTTPQVFTYQSGPNAGQFYNPPPVAGTIKTYGVEIASTLRISPTLQGRANVTLQSPKASQFGTYIQGAKGDGTDDVLSQIPAGDADNNPKLMIRGGLNWTPLDRVSLFAEVNHVGKRAANAANAFYLPAYTTVDIGGSWKATDKFKVQANVANLFDKAGVMSWARAGGFLASLDRQSLAKGQYDRNALYTIAPIQARAFYVTGTYAF